MEINTDFSSVIPKAVVSRSGAPFFVRQNLEVLLGSNRRGLDYKIKSLIQSGIIIPLKKGFYLNNTLYQETTNRGDMLAYVGNMLVHPSYVSLEYSLSLYGILAESVFTITYITTKKTRVFQSGQFSFSYKNIKPDLFFGYTEKKYKNNLTYYMATPAKAIFDFVYLTPLKTKKTIREFLFDSRFNWGVLIEEDKIEFRKIVEKSKSVKMKVVEKCLEKEGVL